MRTADELLVEFLGERDVACPGCGYNLRGVSGARCPECARGLSLVIERPGMAPPVRLTMTVVLLQLAMACWSVIVWIVFLAGPTRGVRVVPWMWLELAKQLLILAPLVVLVCWYVAFRSRGGVQARFVRLGLWSVMGTVGVNVLGSMLIRLMM
jgi:hypothetical protein